MKGIYKYINLLGQAVIILSTYHSTCFEIKCQMHVAKIMPKLQFVLVLSLVKFNYAHLGRELWSFDCPKRIFYRCPWYLRIELFAAWSGWNISERLLHVPKLYLIKKFVAFILSHLSDNAGELKSLVSRYAIHVNPDEGSEGIPLEDFLMIPEFCSCPVAAKLAASHIDKKTGSIHPEAFIMLCSALSSKAGMEEKYKCKQVEACLIPWEKHRGQKMSRHFQAFIHNIHSLM